MWKFIIMSVEDVWLYLYLNVRCAKMIKNLNKKNHQGQLELIKNGKNIMFLVWVPPLNICLILFLAFVVLVATKIHHLWQFQLYIGSWDGTHSLVKDGRMDIQAVLVIGSRFYPFRKPKNKFINPFHTLNKQFLSI